MACHLLAQSWAVLVLVPSLPCALAPLLVRKEDLYVRLAHPVDGDGEGQKAVDLAAVLQNGVVQLLVESLVVHCTVHHSQDDQVEDGAFAAAKAGPGAVVEPGFG